ncbi:Alpha/beta fold hydrolase [Sulfidibacter corallicola]|uniref:Alpha/beta fold hydrolase n=1 Tax=Sulfidibacter corallicola TaxID=2818388 RepID=A0A8A4TG39_SULCO|nr:alpha/beta fold hydrolase [Sulfidibacter corallicola]QTD49039.1 alpha/beta fold hydrolase [Sulfidibacter corallicola]
MRSPPVSPSDRVRRRGMILVVTLALLIAGCAKRSIETPIPSDHWPEPPSQAPRRLMLMLPGYQDSEAHFRRNGFFDLVARQPEGFRDWQLIALDSHVGYFQTGTMPQRIENEVMKAYPDIPVTLLGVSFGGFGALYLARAFPDRVDELVLFAPFLGRRDFLKRLHMEGLSEFQPRDRLERELLDNWRFLLEDSRRTGVEIHILHGESDRLAPAVELLAPKAPHIKVTTRPGGHKWKIWHGLFEAWLRDRKPQHVPAPERP